MPEMITSYLVDVDRCASCHGYHRGLAMIIDRDAQMDYFTCPETERNVTINEGHGQLVKIAEAELLSKEAHARIRGAYYRSDAEANAKLKNVRDLPREPVDPGLVETSDVDPDENPEGDTPISDDFSGIYRESYRANTRQVGGEHYGLSSFQHWDMVAMFDLDYFQGQITKYVMRWKKKNGLVDLEKGLHFLEKYIEIERARQSPADASQQEIPFPKLEFDAISTRTENPE